MRRQMCFVALVLVFLASLLAPSHAVAETPEIRVFVNGELVGFDVPPTVIQGRTLVPLRAILEALGATVGWDEPTQTATATWTGGDLSIQIGGTAARVKGQATPLDVPAQKIDNRTLVPLRFVGEAMGAQVGWYGQSRIITINKSLKTLVEATVTRVTDGDTLEVTLVDGTTEKVRLIGIDTPETVHPTKGVEPYGPEASAFTKERLAGQKVFLETDVEERDQYGRLLAYVYLSNGTMFNAQLADEGYARMATFPPNVRYVEVFRALQADAQADDRGLWGVGEEQSSPVNGTPPNAGGSGSTLRYDPNGPDRDCSDFSTRAEAQAFYQAAGGPARDPHRLDSDRDGIACETLP